MRNAIPKLITLFLLLSILLGCGTTRMTDSTRAASEMLLVSQAVDEAVDQMDFRALAGKPVFVRAEYIDKSLVDRGYLISTIRQQLLAHGALLKEDEEHALYIVELRAGGLGTDRHTLLFGSPALSLPAVLPGQPTQIPEVALVKKTEQKGIAKIGVFAYNRVTGRALWQSGTQEGESTLKDRWVFGAGPFSQGTIRKNTELAGEPLPKLNLPNLNPFPSPFPNPFHFNSDKDKEISKEKESAKEEKQPVQSMQPPATMPAPMPVSLLQPQLWPNAELPVPPQPIPASLLGVIGNVGGSGKELLK